MFPVKDKNTGATKYVGRSKATVFDNKDPIKRGRVRVDHPLFGKTGWIPYLRTNSTFDPPEINDVVYVEADSGVHNYPVAWGNLTRGQADGSSSLPIQFQRNTPTNRGWVTPGGHAIELDDGPGPNDTGSQGIRITTSGGLKIELRDKPNPVITITDKGANLPGEAVVNEITLDPTGGPGGDLALKVSSTGTINISATGGNVVVNTPNKVQVTSDTIELGNHTLKKLVNESFQAIFNSHTHSAGTLMAGAPIGGTPVFNSTGGPSATISPTELTADTKAS